MTTAPCPRCDPAAPRAACPFCKGTAQAPDAERLTGGPAPRLTGYPPVDTRPSPNLPARTIDPAELRARLSRKATA